MEIKTAWEVELTKLKLLDAKQIAKDTLYSEQRLFDYSDKRGKQLARISANTPIPNLPPMIKDGQHNYR